MTEDRNDDVAFFLSSELCMHMCRRGYPLRYSGGSPERSGRPSVGSNPTETTIQGRKWGTGPSGALAHVQTGNCTEVDTPLCRYGRLDTISGCLT